MVTNLILAGAAVYVTVSRPRSWLGAATNASIAATAVILGVGALRPALEATAPTVGFLLVAVGSAAVAVRLGAAAWLAALLARTAGGRPMALYALVCLSTVVATAAVSLDGAVVLLVPVVLELARRFGASLRPLLLGVAAVANAFSLALPEGNPTNLVVIGRLGTTLGGYAERALPAGLAAAAVCGAGVAWLERGNMARGRGAVAPPAGLSSGLGAVVRLGVQLSSLLVLLIPLSVLVPPTRAGGLSGTLLVAAAAAVAAALVNNLPASAAIAAGLSGSAAFAALAGVSVGALATEHGSVATLLAGELAGSQAYERRLVPVVAAALAVAATLLWLTGR